MRFRSIFFTVVPILIAIPVLFATLFLQAKAPVMSSLEKIKAASVVRPTDAMTLKDPVVNAALFETGDNMILVELCNQNLLNPEFLRTDEKFGALVDTEYPLVLEGYRVWAPPVVNWMRRSKRITLWVSMITKPWTAEIAYVMGEQVKGSLIGKVEMYFGFILSWVIGATLTYLYVQLAWLLLISLWMYLGLRRLFKTNLISVWNVSRKESLNEK